MKSVEFSSLASEVLKAGHELRFQAGGESMRPFILDGDILTVAPYAGKRAACGEVVLAETSAGKILAHCVIKTRRREGIQYYLLKGDASDRPDGWLGEKEILGWVEAVERGGRKRDLSTIGQRLRARIWIVIAPWAPKLFWLPETLRRSVRKWFLGSLIPD